MKPKILVLSSTYPVNVLDTQPGFVKHLCDELSVTYDVHVLAPVVRHVVDAQAFSGSVKVTRFRYAPRSLEMLCGGDGILENLKKNKCLYALLPLFLLSMLYATIRCIQKNDISIVHAHWIIPQGCVAVLSKFFLRKPIKILVTSHGGDLFALNSSIVRRIKKVVLQQANHITVVSNAMKQVCLNEFDIPSDKITVRSMGVDLASRFVPKGTKQLGRLVFVGRLVEKKGVDVLLNALAELKLEFDQFQIDIIGGGKMLNGYQQMANELSLSKHVRFVGPLPNSDIIPFLQQAEIAVFPFKKAANGDQEGLGLTVVEAMGCECLAIVSKLPATEDLIECGINGFFVEQNNPEQLALMIKRCLQDKSILGLSKEARSMALQKFDWVSVGREYSKIISRL